MVTKISLNVEIPAIGKTLNFLVPETMKFANVIELISSIVSKEFQGIEDRLNNLILVEVKSKKVLDKEYSCLDLNIHNGSRLMLM